MLQPYQIRFLELAVDRGALGFGGFTLKSGRESPYFFNAARFDSGAALATVATCYADALAASGLEVDMLFGPAYKGIPLASALAVELARRGHDLPLAFNRKEAKAHGEGGQLIGAPLRGRVLIVDDVLTAGTAVRESIGLLRSAGAEPAGLLVALDREERGATGTGTAADLLAADFGLPVRAIAGLGDLLGFTSGRPGLEAHRDALLSYRRRYGISS